MNADGSGQVNITNTGANEIQPSWSSDSAKIAFASDRDQAGFPSIYVMNANGSSQTRLTWSGTGLRDEQPMWSPDRTKIAFTSTRDSVTETWQETDDDGNYITKSKLDINKEVYVMNASGSGQTRLTTVLENDDSPCWTTDGTKIVFRSERTRDAFDPTAQIWTMNADGSNQTNLSNSGDADSSPSWTSNSNQSPVANAAGPYNAIVAQAVTFNGSGSFVRSGRHHHELCLELRRWRQRFWRDANPQLCSGGNLHGNFDGDRQYGRDEQRDRCGDRLCFRRR